MASSASFECTNKAVAKLARFSDFTESQLNEIVQAAVSKPQIYWIAHDCDVHLFLKALVEGREEMIDPENLPRIKYVIIKIEEYGEIPSFSLGNDAGYR